MNILAFDTCLDKMYIGGSIEDKILPSKIVETTKEHYHSAFLISTIKEFLKENALKPNDIDVIATNVGPGSFTGIRACTTVARIFAQQLNKKAVGVSSLEILSRINTKNKSLRDKKPQDMQETHTEAISPNPNRTLVALDARKEMAYVAVYNEGAEILTPQVMLLDDLKEIIKKENYFVITDNKLEPILGGVSYQKDDYDLGKFLVEIAQEKFKTDFDSNWQKLLPLYIQPPAVHK